MTWTVAVCTLIAIVCIALIGRAAVHTWKDTT
jgi:hypothetical protein